MSSTVRLMRSPANRSSILEPRFSCTNDRTGSQHHSGVIDTAGLSMRTRNLCCGLSEPVFETRLAESCVIVRNQCSLADFRPRVKRFWVSDDFAGVFECG